MPLDSYPHNILLEDNICVVLRAEEFTFKGGLKRQLCYSTVDISAQTQDDIQGLQQISMAASIEMNDQKASWPLSN